MNLSIENCLQLSQELGQKLLAKKWTICTAESCTGGMLASAITAVPGSSAWFGYGLVAYANQAKEQLLAVSPLTLAREGAVSEAAVLEMAKGALKLSGANIAVAISGIAGPDGGTVEKPVGSIWLAWATHDQTITQFKNLSGDRQAIQTQSTLLALKGSLELLK